MKHRRFWKTALLLALPVALFAFVAECDSWRPRTIAIRAIEPGRLQFSPDGRTLVFTDDPIYICDVASLTERVSIKRAWAFCFMEKGKYLAATCTTERAGVEEERVKIFAVRDGKAVASGPKNFTPVGVLADQSTLIGGLSDESVAARRKLFRWNWRSNRAPQPYGRLSKDPEGPVSILSDKATLSDGKHFWDLSTGKMRFQLESNEARFQLSNPSSFMAFRDGNKVRIWNCRTGKVHGSIAVTSSPQAGNRFKVSPDGTMLAELEAWRRAGKPQINLWDIPSGRLLRQIEVPVSSSNAYSLALSPDGRTLALALSRAIKLWRIK